MRYGELVLISSWLSGMCCVMFCMLVVFLNVMMFDSEIWKFCVSVCLVIGYGLVK